LTNNYRSDTLRVMFRKVLGLGSEMYKRSLRTNVLRQGLQVLSQKQSARIAGYRKKSLRIENLAMQDVKKALESSDQSLIVMVRG
jgi:hypothetical protein